MKLLKTSMAILFAASLLTACEGKDKKVSENNEADIKTENTTTDKSPATKLDGAWEIKRAEGSMSEMNVGTVYEFKGNKLSFGKGEQRIDLIVDASAWSSGVFIVTISSPTVSIVQRKVILIK